MSIYKKEASLEEMKREAISRMELLKLDTQTIQDFERDGSVNLSQQLGDQVFLHSGVHIQHSGNVGAQSLCGWRWPRCGRKHCFCRCHRAYSRP